MHALNPARTALLAALLACRVFGQDAASFYRQGVDLHQRGDLAGAAEAYRKSLALDAGNVAAHSNLGAALAGLGRFDDAVPEYEKALAGAEHENAQFRPQLKRNLALAYYKSGRMHDAAPILIALHQAEPESHEAAMLAADCLLQMGEPAQALDVLEPLAPGAASDKALAYVLGVTYLKTGRTADAQRVLDPLLKDDTSAEGKYALGMAMFTSGDYPAAVGALRRAIQLNPSLARVESYYGQALIFSGDPDGALAAFRKQLQTDPNDFESNYRSALILSRRGSYAEAEPLLRRAVLLRPKSGEARLALAEALLGENQTAAARDSLESIVREWPEFSAAHARLSGLYGKIGLRTESAKEQELALKYRKPGSDSAVDGGGPKIGDPAPRFQLAKAEGGGTLSLPASGKPAVLVFGSYTCPNFRKAAPVLNELAGKLEGKVAFLQVYIREAHAAGQWQSTVNERESVELAMPSSMNEKHDYAVMCQRKLHLRFPAVVDGLDDAAEKAYAAWPSRVYVIGADGRVRYSSALIEEDFDAAALETAIRPAAGRH